MRPPPGDSICEGRYAHHTHFTSEDHLAEDKAGEADFAILHRRQKSRRDVCGTKKEVAMVATVGCMTSDMSLSNLHARRKKGGAMMSCTNRTISTKLLTALASVWKSHQMGCCRSSFGKARIIFRLSILGSSIQRSSGSMHSPGTGNKASDAHRPKHNDKKQHKRTAAALSTHS